MHVIRMLLTTGFCCLSISVSAWSKDAPAAAEEKPEDGLELKLKIKPTALKGNTPVELSCTVRNSTGAPVQIAAWGILDVTQALDVLDAHGKPMPVGGGRNHTKPLPADAFPTLKNGESKTFHLKAAFSNGRLTVHELGGGVWTWELPAGKYQVRALFNVSDVAAIRASFPADNKAPIWSGSTHSPPVEITVGP